MRSKLDHQRGQTIDVGAMTSHPCGVPIELPFDNVVPFPQSGHQGLVVASKELDMLPGLTKLPFQTINLERPPCQQSLIARATRKPTLSLSFISITHSLIETADECLIASVEAVI